jgi:pimeloyl-ACP methyl ester carboxylesterase
MPRAPRLRITGDGARSEAVVLLLPGGTDHSFLPVRAFDPGVVRVFPFGRSVVRAGGGRISLASLRYAVRGWNGEQESPLSDARWALDRIRERFGDVPIGLVGHSMGGRVALRVADHLGVHNGGTRVAGVRSVVALAPWLPKGEPVAGFEDQALLLAHGTADRTTDPGQTFELAEKLTAEGVDVELVRFPGAHHAMMFPARPWHDLVAKFMVRTLLTAVPDGPAPDRRR